MRRGCGSGVEPMSSYLKVTRPIPLVCIIKVPLGKLQVEPQTAPDALVCTLHSTHHVQYMNYSKSLWTKKGHHKWK